LSPSWSQSTYRSRNLCVDLGELDEGLVEVLDSLCSIFGRFVANVADASVVEELYVSDGKLGKVFPHVIFGEVRGQIPHEDA